MLGSKLEYFESFGIRLLFLIEFGVQDKVEVFFCKACRRYDFKLLFMEKS
jgi:hypothetical protein